MGMYSMNLMSKVFVCRYYKYEQSIPSTRTIFKFLMTDHAVIPFFQRVIDCLRTQALTVAIKSDNLEVAHLLLDRGADVNFADAVNPYGINFSAPIWYDAIGQCFMRAGDLVKGDFTMKMKSPH